MSAPLEHVMRVYQGSDGDATKALYERLAALGITGLIAVDVFRAQKASERAKKYRGGTGGKSYARMAYERKQWAMNKLADLLVLNAKAQGISWGWGEDPKQEYHRQVLYIDLPTGQISWHTEHRGAGPDYPGQWDGIRNASVGRIVSWVAQVLDTEKKEAP
jgi:hypothetical protein